MNGQFSDNLILPRVIGLHRLSSSVNFDNLYLPDAIACPTVTPAALYLLESVDAALLSSEAASWPINVLYSGFRIDGKMKKEVYHFTV